MCYENQDVWKTKKLETQTVSLHIYLSWICVCYLHIVYFVYILHVQISANYICKVIRSDCKVSDNCEQLVQVNYTA